MTHETVDTIFYGGDIITMDESSPTAEALAVKGENITAVGKLGDVFKLAGPTTQVIYLNKQTLLPGFIEPHQHAIQSVLCNCLYTNISGYYCHTYEEVKQIMQREIAKANLKSDPLPWCIFLGWDIELIPNLPKLSANFLDTEFTDKIPVVVIGQTFHVAWANHKALEVARVDITTEEVGGAVYVRENGQLTGELIEVPAIVRVLTWTPSLSPEELTKAVQSQWRNFASCGFTTVTDLSYLPKEELNLILAKVSKDENCPVRLGLYRLLIASTSPSESDLKSSRKIESNDKLWEAGVKLMLDGSPHCGTAATREPYLNTNLTKSLGFSPPPCYGNLSYTFDEVYQTVKFYHEKGEQVAIHAHGERAIDQVISVYEKVLSECKTPSDMRHRIEHLGLATEDQIAQAGKMNLALSFFVCHLYFYAKSYTEYIFGAERTNRWAPLSLATKHNLRWTIHQDNPCFPGPPLPFANMKTAVTRTQRDDNETVYGPEYRVTIHEALRAYTINAAWQIHRDDQLGSLTVNKKADLVILSHNPYNVDPMKLEDIKVVDTFIGGRSNKLSKTKSKMSPGCSAVVYHERSKI